LLRPPMAWFSTLILAGSKNLAIGSPQPIWPLVPVLTVESPTMNKVGRLSPPAGVAGPGPAVMPSRAATVIVGTAIHGRQVFMVVLPFGAGGVVPRVRAHLLW